MIAETTLMDALADGEVHSGATLARRFGITRAAVWKRIARLRAQGVVVDAVAGSGYRMVQAWRALDRERILVQLQPRTTNLLGSLQVVATIDSTNDALRDAAATLPDGSVLVAEHQTRGRGRRGRAWLSPLGAGLWFSVLARSEGGVGALAGLSLAVAVLVAEALEQLGVPRVRLKWPNDLCCDDRKLGGILIELAGDWHGPCTAVIGIGINVALSAASRAQIGQPAIDLAQALGTAPERNRVMVALLDALLPGLETFRRKGLDAFRERWFARDALRGREVFVDGAIATAGIAEGIDVEGRLRIVGSHGALLITAGEVSVRAVPAAPGNDSRNAA